MKCPFSVKQSRFYGLKNKSPMEITDYDQIYKDFFPIKIIQKIVKCFIYSTERYRLSFSIQLFCIPFYYYFSWFADNSPELLNEYQDEKVNSENEIFYFYGGVTDMHQLVLYLRRKIVNIPSGIDVKKNTIDNKIGNL